jgi:hypothetical protein
MNMIDKVARGLLKSIYSGVDYDTLNDETKNAWLYSARAAIASMREPTYKMVNDADAPDMPAGGDAGTIWQSMIDAALKE